MTTLWTLDPPLDAHIIGKTTLRYRQAGSGPPMLMLHGLQSSSHTWQMLAEHLAPSYSILAPDLPGFGFSTCEEDFDFSLESYARVLLAFLEARNWRTGVLVAHSYGCAVACALACMAAERFDKMVHIAPCDPRSLGENSNPKALENLLLFSYSDRTFLTPELLGFYAKLQNRPQGNRAAEAIINRFTVDGEAFGAAQCTVPTQVIWGKEDLVIPASARNALRSWKTLAEVKLIEHAGHNAHEEQAATVAAHIRAFLSGRSP